MSFRRILIAVDDGPISARAAELGLELVRRLKARAAFISVADPSVYTAPEGGISAGKAIAMAVRDGKGLLSSFRRRGSSGSSRLEFVPVGKPAVEIVKVAKQWGADLIVIGSHGRRGVPRVLMGSVAEAVMRRAACPVVVVGPKR